MQSTEESATLIDRLAIGCLSAVSILLTILLVWVICLFGSVGLLPLWFPKGTIIVITVGFFLLGFFTLDNYVVKVLTPIWRILDRLLRKSWNGL